MNKKKEPEKDKSERWLLTYSDLMNLLLILFIIMYVSSKADTAKAQAVAKSIREGFNGGKDTIVTYVTSNASQLVGDSIGGSSSEGESSNISQDQMYNDFYNQLVKLLADKGLTGQVIIAPSEKGVILSFNDNVLFASGKASLDTSAVNLITDIGGLLKQVTFTQILVEGHTDSDPIQNSEFADNRALSSARANNVAEELVSCGLQPDHIFGIGYGEYKPLVSNDTPADKAKNRRVVINIMRGDLTASSSISTSK